MFGIIPTRVGTSFFTSSQQREIQDHPHACGDKSRTAQRRSSFLGSSPRVWGQVVELSKTEVTKRIIPTRVGTRRLAEVEMLIKRDHPHACGDKGSAGLSGALCLGSSPRVWGQVCECVKHSDNIRIIPTRVGTSEIGRAHV